MDENKTALTHRVTATSAAYLDGWIADLASYWYPTVTEAKKLHLDRHAREILGTTAESAYVTLPRVFGSGPFTVVVEVKTARGDFARDDRKWQQWPAHICCVAYPGGVVDKVPEGWYGLEVSKDGRTLRKVHRTWASPHAQHSGLVIDFVAAVGIRRDHRTRYAATRAFLKAYRAEEQEQKKRHSAGRLLEGLAAWIQGKGWQAERPLVEVLPKLGIKKLPAYCRDAIAFFETLRNGQDDP
jgi:hypothetical protein